MCHKMVPAEAVPRRLKFALRPELRVLAREVCDRRAALARSWSHVLVAFAAFEGPVALHEGPEVLLRRHELRRHEVVRLELHRGRPPHDIDAQVKADKLRGVREACKAVGDRGRVLWSVLRRPERPLGRTQTS